jgi:hypothetical protein
MGSTVSIVNSLGNLKDRIWYDPLIGGVTAGKIKGPFNMAKRVTFMSDNPRARLVNQRSSVWKTKEYEDAYQARQYDRWHNAKPRVFQPLYTTDYLAPVRMRTMDAETHNSGPSGYVPRGLYSTIKNRINQ